jgi:hypothetical protein
MANKVPAGGKIRHSYVTSLPYDVRRDMIARYVVAAAHEEDRFAVHDYELKSKVRYLRDPNRHERELRGMMVDVWRKRLLKARLENDETGEQIYTNLLRKAMADLARVPAP